MNHKFVRDDHAMWLNPSCQKYVMLECRMPQLSNIWVTVKYWTLLERIFLWKHVHVHGIGLCVFPPINHTYPIYVFYKTETAKELNALLSSFGTKVVHAPFASDFPACVLPIMSIHRDVHEMVIMDMVSSNVYRTIDEENERHVFDMGRTIYVDFLRAYEDKWVSRVLSATLPDDVVGEIVKCLHQQTNDRIVSTLAFTQGIALSQWNYPVARLLALHNAVGKTAIPFAAYRQDSGKYLPVLRKLVRNNMLASHCYTKTTRSGKRY